MQEICLPGSEGGAKLVLRPYPYPTADFRARRAPHPKHSLVADFGVSSVERFAALWKITATETHHLLGGRMGKPFLYLSGQTPFNGNLFGSEHLSIEDE